VLKGARTVVAAPDGRLARATFENPAMATGGTGDVLSGTIGALLAQHLDPFDAARLGVFLHGTAGEAIRDRLGDAGLLASDLLFEIALGRKRLAAARARRTAERKLGFGVRPARSSGAGSAAGEPAPAPGSSS
jgi:NAD(P)H-hydrate epimerase